MADYLPIFDFDPDPEGLVSAEYDPCPPLPKKGLLAFLGDDLEEYAEEEGLEAYGLYHSISRDFPIFVTEYKGEEICFMRTALGAPSAVQHMEWMISHGVETIMETGSCGALEDLEENGFIIPTKALRDEGTSYKYQPAAPWIDLDPKAQGSIKKTLDREGIPYSEKVLWTTDAFYRETPALLKKRVGQGCQVVDMECSALTACARFRKVNFGALLYTGDSLANLETWERRGMGEGSRQAAIRLCLECLHQMGN